MPSSINELTMIFRPSESLLVLFFVFTLNLSFAQTDSSIVSIGAITNSGFTLDHGWRFSQTDRPEHATPNFDDRSWPVINPTLRVTDMPEVKDLEIGWLRLHLRAYDSLQGQTLLLATQQSCASEVYLDGKLIKTYGVVHTDPDKRIVFGVNQPPVSLHLSPGEHVLAIRIAISPSAYIFRSINTLMVMALHGVETYEAALRAELVSTYLYVFLASIFFLLALLHVAFFIYDHSKRANIYFSAYALLNTISFAIVALFPIVKQMPLILLLYVVTFGFVLTSAVWLIEALLKLYGYLMHRLRMALWMALAVAIVALFFDNLVRVFGFTLLLFEGVQVWLIVNALRDRRRGAGIIGISFGISLGFLVSGIIIGVFNLDVAIMVWNLIWAAVFLSPAFGISLYLSREFALDSKSLREKLAEVEKLSELTIAQEQEKQQLLTDQNETLEVLVNERTQQLNESLINLKSAQAQLVQSEKMASLGELTAGIAHEIQNPLNFVNNFSEISIELFDELKEELEAGNQEEVVALADDIRQNLQKIGHHGKRADNIVKGMLQHSHAGSGTKEPIDINPLIEEYLRLSYHRIHDKNKSLEVELVTDFDPKLPVVKVVPQEIGKVLLNLFNNAFYAVAGRARTADNTYKPKIEVQTRRYGDGVEILVMDNGVGIQESIRTKIFQPFFTTKPTGEGTGLGLSLSYDIVVKGHGGKLELIEAEELTVFRLIL